MDNNGRYRNQIPELTSLSDLRYENIFKVYQRSDGLFFYNILKKISFPDNLNENIFYYITVNERMPWTTISYNAYGTIELWWLIMLVNKLTNPINVPKGNIKILKQEYVRPVISQIQSQL